MKYLFFILSLSFYILSTTKLYANTSEWDGSSSDISWYQENIKEFHIKSAAQLKGLADIVNNDIHNFENEIVFLDEDINLNGFPWTPIGLSKDWKDTQNNNYHPFKGVFDGGDHTIKKVMLDLSTIDCHRYPIVGLFGYVEGGKLKNINLQGEVDINPNYANTAICIGGLVGKVVDGEIEHVTADFNITDNCGAKVYLGVVAGNANLISKVKTQGNIKDADYIFSSGEIGGIAGRAQTIIEADSKVSIYIRTSAASGPTYIGGIAGSSHTIKDVIFTGNNYNHNYGSSTNQLLLVGGICANLNNGTINNAICCADQNYASSDRNINNVFIGSIIPNSFTQYTSITNSYYSLNSTSVSNGGIGVGNELGIGVESSIFFSGEPLEGFDTNIWLFKIDNFPELKAFLPVAKYTLTYYVDGKVYKEYLLKEGEPITPEAEPTKEGYTFSGWSWIPSKMPAEDVSVIGSFIANKYKLTYIVDGEIYKSYDITFDSPITPEAKPEKEGYTFSGWSYIPSKMPAEDVTVTGTFTLNKYKLTYILDDKVYKEVEYEYGATIVPEQQPEGDYISFEWMGLPDTMPAHDVTVYANYETGIHDVMMPQNVIRIYNSNGIIIDSPQKGLNIMQMSNGTTKKVLSH